MSGGSTAAMYTLAAVSAASAAYQVSEQKKIASDQARQAAESLTQAKANAKTQEEAINAANKKKPDMGSILASNKSGANGGIGSTMLTGPQGVDLGALSLGKSTLLGQ